ncbi:hypothetical protein AAVH_34682, partial [Aphelenchoides avenae]
NIVGHSGYAVAQARTRTYLEFAEAGNLTQLIRRGQLTEPQIAYVLRELLQGQSHVP